MPQDRQGKCVQRWMALQHKKLSNVRLGFEVKGDVALESGQSLSGTDTGKWEASIVSTRAFNLVEEKEH